MANKKAQSVINLYSEMVKALTENIDNYIWLISKCDRQENLAKLQRKGKGIDGMSLNSFKKYCNAHVQAEGNLNGYEVVDKLRKDLIARHNQTLQYSNKKNLNLSPLDEAKRQIDNLRRNQAILIRAYNDLNSLTLDLLANSNGNALEYNKHKELYACYFGLKRELDDGE